MDLSVAHVELVIRQPEILLQPIEKSGLENSAASIKRITRELY